MKKNKLEKAVETIINKLERAEKFTLSQAPDICKEIIKEKKVANFYWLTVYILGTLINGASSLKLAVTFSDKQEMLIIPILIAMVCLTFLMLSLSVTQELISLYVAPKLTILRELRSLLQKEE